MSHVLTPGQIHRMPTTFGPTLSPRQNALGGTYDYGAFESLSYFAAFEGDPDQLQRLLPPGFALQGAMITARFSYLSNIEWLAGRGYAVLSVTAPARYSGKRDEVTGNFQLVLWENMPEPIMTGREEVGMPKLYAQISEPRSEDGVVVCEASWDGHLFARLEFRADQNRANADAANLPAYGAETLTYKYVPGTPDEGTWTEPDAEYAVASGSAGDVATLESVAGQASIALYPTTWRQMPTQYLVVEALRGLTQYQAGPGQMTVTRGWGAMAGAHRLR
jgi:hypothetical protein